MPKARYKKEGSGLYYCNVPTNEFRPDGYRKFKKLRAKSQAELDEKKKAYEEALVAGVEPNKTTLDQWYERWIVAYKSGTAENTKAYYKNLYTAHIKPALGAVRLSEIKEIHGQQILSALGETHAERTVKGVRQILCSLMDSARKNKLITVNPFADLKISGAKRQERRYLTDEERAGLISACAGSEFGTFGLILFFFGLRRGEALALTGADILKGEIRINKQITYPTNSAPILKLTPKTDAGNRTIPIPAKARALIDFDALRETDGLLFSDGGRPYSYSQIVDRWKKLAKAAFGEGSDITMHYLRHNYCTMLCEQGVDLLTVKALAGHTNIKTTLEYYTHYTERIRQASTNKVDAIG